MGRRKINKRPEPTINTIDILMNIQKFIDNGDSIGLAVKKSCYDSSKIQDKIMATNGYCSILNSYMRKIGKNMKYKLENGALVRETFSKKSAS